MSNLEQLLKADRPFLTDGGFETWLFFQKGFAAPEFAAIVLMDNDEARQAMHDYFDGFLELAEDSNTGFVLDTNTWRGCLQWAGKLNKSEAELLRLSQAAVDFAKDIRDAWQARLAPILINGVVGPAGDAYVPGTLPDAASAYDMHLPQIELFARTGVDLISAITMTNIGEATGIANAAQYVNLPVVISFTVETDGHLPTGMALGDAIGAVDAATNHAPLYYMVNCAHPDHFTTALAAGSDWVSRIGGVRANASRLSHAELDAAETLDDGDPEEFGCLHLKMARHLPGLRVFGGCCGTDHRHIESVARHLAAIKLTA